MKVDFSDFDDSHTYSENGQIAKNAFACGHMTKDVYYPSSQWFICRDFFSDLAVSHHADIHFECYGFNTEAIAWDGSGFLSTWKMAPSEIHKQMKILNKYLVYKKLPKIKKHLLFNFNSVTAFGF